MHTRSIFLAAALSIAVVGSAQAKVRNDAGALAAAGVLGGALGYLGGSYASQPSYGQPYGRQGYYPQQRPYYPSQPYYEQPAYYAPRPPVYYAPPPPVFYQPPTYVYVQPPGYYVPQPAPQYFPRY